ncbi:MAG: hypothetical protein ACLFVJ_17710 [Persicimonas sp.]
MRVLLINLFAISLIFAGCSNLSGVADKATGKAGAGAAKKAAKKATSDDADDADDTDDIEDVGLNPQDKNILNNVDKIAEQCPIDGSTPYGEDDAFSTKKDAVYQCETGLPRVKKQLESIDRPKRAHPRYVDAKKYVTELSDVVPEWARALDKEYAKGRKNAKLGTDYSDVFGNSDIRIIKALWRVKNDEEMLSLSGEHNFDKDVEAARALEEHTEECKEKYDTGENYTRYDDDEAMAPMNACDVVYNWREYMPEYLNDYLVASVDVEREDIQTDIDRLEREGYIFDGDRQRMANLEEHVKELETSYGEVLGELESDLEADAQASLQELLELSEPFEKTFEKAAAESRWSKDGLHAEPEAEKAIKEIFASAKSMKVLDYGVDKPDWYIKKGANNIPVSRHHRGFALVKVDGESFCRIYDFSASGQYDGTGYTRASVTDVNPERDVYKVTTCR